MDKTLDEEIKIKEEVGGLIDRDRVVSFSDAVFAFAATLLVLKIDLPAATSGQLSSDFFQLFAPLLPQYGANIISFLIIGYYWLNHHAIFGLVKRFDGPIVWINLVFLVVLSFLPFPVDLYGENFMVPSVVVFYSLSLGIVGLMLAVIWIYASSGHRLIRKDMTQRMINFYLARNLVAPVVFLLSVPLVFVHPMLAQISWLFVVFGTVLINKFYKVGPVSVIEKDSI